MTHIVFAVALVCSSGVSLNHTTAASAMHGCMLEVCCASHPTGMYVAYTVAKTMSDMMIEAADVNS